MTQQHIRLIAEAGVNHNGSLETALALVDAAAAAGADIVKFQTFRAERLASAHAPKAAYQVRQTGGGESQLEMLRRLELRPEDHFALMARCRERGIGFLSTPFDGESLHFLSAELGLAELKLGSGELTNGPLLLAAARTGRRLILSTGMGTLAEVEQALGVIAFGMLVPEEAPPSPAAFAKVLREPAAWAALRDRVTLLHCTTEYPAPPEEANLRAMETMRAAFGVPVGYSDHTRGLAVAIAAAAMGASVIEKHLTLDRTLAGPDHAASLEPAEFAELVSAVRTVEAALGDGRKQPVQSELANRAVARKSLVAARPLRAGRALTPDDIAVKRPGTGASPMTYWSVLGRTIERDYAPEEPLEP